MSRVHLVLGIAALAACVVGMVVAAIGFALDDGPLLDVGAWLTVPWTVIAGAPVLLLVVCAVAAPITAAWEWAAARRRRRD